jgi:protein-disulfide isomerase
MQVRKVNLITCLSGLLVIFAGAARAEEKGFSINGKVKMVDDIYKENQGQFFELEKKKYELIENLAIEGYLDSYWKEMATKQSKSVEQAREEFLENRSKVSDNEIKDNLEKFKDHPKLKELSEAERKQQVVAYLKSMKSQEAVDQIVDEAIQKKKLIVLYPKPEEPVFQVPVVGTDVVRYGPNATDTNPITCNGNNCEITVVEYSEFQCPFCEKVLPTTAKLLEEYKGKVRWIVRDFPLGFHNRARPAAVAARCAADQGKYWQMYYELFNNQRALSDENLMSYGKKVGLDQKKYEKCFKSPEKQNAVIDKNYASGEKLGVTGTPAFFINGRRVSGALPYESFKQIFEEEIAKTKKKS